MDQMNCKIVGNGWKTMAVDQRPLLFHCLSFVLSRQCNDGSVNDACDN